MRGKAVIVLHGLGGAARRWTRSAAICARKAGTASSTSRIRARRRDIAEHARALPRIIDNLDGIEEINFVAHSMGNIVIRHYLAGPADEAAALAARPAAASASSCSGRPTTARWLP